MNGFPGRIDLLDVSRRSGATPTSLRIIVILLPARLAATVPGQDKAANAPAFRLRGIDRGVAVSAGACLPARL